MNDLLKDRIRAHRSAPDVYDPPSFEDMARRIDELEAGRAKGQADYCALMNRHDAQAVRIEELHAKNADPDTDSSHPYHIPYVAFSLSNKSAEPPLERM